MRTMLQAFLATALLAAGPGPAPAKPAPTDRSEARLAAAGNRPTPASDSLRTGRRTYLRETREKVAEIDRRLDRILADSLARYRPDSVYRRQVLAKARAERDHVETLMDDLTAVEGSLAPAPWDSMKATLRISLDSLQRLYLSADSSAKAQQGDRRAKLDPRIEDIRGGGGREWRRERRDVEESRGRR